MSSLNSMETMRPKNCVQVFSWAQCRINHDWECVLGHRPVLHFWVVIVFNQLGSLGGKWYRLLIRAWKHDSSIARQLWNRKECHLLLFFCIFFCSVTEGKKFGHYFKRRGIWEGRNAGRCPPKVCLLFCFMSFQSFVSFAAGNCW